MNEQNYRTARRLSRREILRGAAAAAAGLAGAVLIGRGDNAVYATGHTAARILPTSAKPGQRFTIVDTPAGRLTAGSVAVFTRQAGGGGTDAVLTTHKPGKTAQGTVPAVPGTTYDVTVRQVNGTTFPVGSMEVKGDEPVVTIAPTSGAVDTPFTITDTGGRIQQGDVAIFTPQGGDPATAGIATNGTISADGTTFDGTVPDSITTTGQFFVRVTPAGDQPGRFADLPFFVT